MARRPTPWHAEARRLRAQGLTLRAIGKLLGVRHQSVMLATRELPVPAVKARGDFTRVPTWARRADLADEYFDTMLLLGEHEAASHCRAMLAERRGAA